MQGPGVPDGVVGGVAGRHEHAVHPIGPQRVDRQGGHQRGVDPAGEPDDDIAEAVLGDVVAGTEDCVLDPTQGLSALLSEVADEAYPDTPHIANEMIARRDLTSQGAKARRFLTDALIANQSSDAFGIDGYGPDRAIYEAVFRKTGLHRRTTSGEWTLHNPT